VVATMIYDHGWNGAEKFLVLSLSFPISRRTTEEGQNGIGGGRTTKGMSQSRADIRDGRDLSVLRPICTAIHEHNPRFWRL
jgi:hypothetical protein